MASRPRKISAVSVRAITAIDEPSGEQVLRSDTAGNLVQLVAGTILRHAAYIEFMSGLTARRRANHFHPTRDEWMYVISGRLAAAYYDPSTDEYLELVLTKGDFVSIRPGCGHVYEALEDSSAIEMSPQARTEGDTLPMDVLGEIERAKQRL
jgi:mannose-6-phosphate isomerase-like protein (cupin superfamily)